ncbi:MAG: DNA polymerase ligase N-terminal domain-containing protein [Thermodesulfobacteriota bacterium]
MSVTNNFLIIEHKTSHTHYDFYMELEQEIKSWIIPNGLPQQKKEKKIAVQDDPAVKSIKELKSERNFLDSYGRGDTEIWDRGSFTLETNKNIKIIFEADGEKLLGKYLLHVPNWGKWTKKTLWTIEKIS